MEHRALVLVVLLLLPPGSPAAGAVTQSAATAPASDFTRRKESAGRERIAALATLAELCHTNKAYLQRDKAYEALLVLDPEHAVARKTLRYQKDRKTGLWSRRGYVAPKDTKGAFIDQALTQRAELDALYAAFMLDLIDEFAAELGPAPRRAELQALLASAPDDERTRAALGFVAVERQGQRHWVERTTVEAAARRYTIADAVEKARAAVPALERGAARQSETEWGIPWAMVLQTDRARVLGVNRDGEAELEVITRHGHLLWDVLRVLCGLRMRAPLDLAIYDVEDGAHKESLIAKHPRITDRQRELYPRLSSGWLGSAPHLALWAPEAAIRVECATRQFTSWYLTDGFGVQGKHGWITEGFGLYLSQLICGTRRTFTVVQSRYVDTTEPNFEHRLGEPDADWFADSLTVLQAAPPTRLASTLGKDPNEMTRADIVLAYTLASYLIEGHGADTVRKILSRIGGDESVSSTVALEETLQTTLPELQQGLQRWIQSVGAQAW